MKVWLLWSGMNSYGENDSVDSVHASVEGANAAMQRDIETVVSMQKERKSEMSESEFRAWLALSYEIEEREVEP